MQAMVGEQAPELFAWLRSQPFVESTAAGLYPHDVVREALEADLRWRDPEGFRTLHHRMHQYLFEQVRAAPPGQVLGAVGAMLYMYRSNGHMPEFHEWHALGLVQDTPCAPQDEQRLVELTEQAEGPQSAAIVRFWLDHQPEAFRVYRSTRTGDIVAFTTVLWLDEKQGRLGADIDPVVAAAWAHSRTHAPLRAGERKAVARFTIHPPLYQRPSAPTTLAQWRLMAEVAEARVVGPEGQRPVRMPW
ncbi:hypothetical protein ACWC0A_31700 [Streptomyces scopuliridis]